MKSKLILLVALTLLTLLFSPFTHAEIVPQKIIAVSDVTAVERFYNHNQNYKTIYTKKAFEYAVCLLNPEHFKKCSDYEFRHMAPKAWYFPALPTEAKNIVTVKQIYRENEVYRVLFPSFIKFQREVCKNNPEKFNNCTIKTLKIITKSVGLKITSRPLTYLIPGEKNNSVVFEGKTFTKTKKGYYLLTPASVVKEIKTGEIKIKEDTVRATKDSLFSKNTWGAVHTDVKRVLIPHCNGSS